MPTEDYQKRIEQTTENIADSEAIGETNKELLRDYKRDQMLNGLSEATLLKNLSRLKVLSENSDKPFNEMDKSDIKDLLEWVHSQGYTDETVDTYKTVMRGFWTWLNDGETPAEIEWIKLSNGNSNDTLPKDLLTKEDIEKQIEAAKNARDRAFIYMLYETGARIGELIDLTVGDIEDRKHGRKVVINGKTGSRRLPLVECVPYLNQWQNEHPNTEKGAPLWCKVQQGGPKEHLIPQEVEDVEQIHGIGSAYAEKLREAGIKDGQDLLNHDISEVAEIAGVREATAQKWFNQFDKDTSLSSDAKLGYRYIREKILKKNMDRADIDKPSNPHHYRHSRASELATEMTEAQLCEWFGWVQGSDVPQRYVHLSGRDLDDSYDQLHGLYEPDEQEQQPDVVECPRCSELNQPEATFCMQCGFGLDQEAAEDFEAEAEDNVKQDYRDIEPGDNMAEKLETLDELMSDPEIKSFLEQQS